MALNSFILSLQSIRASGLHSIDPSTVGVPGSLSSDEITGIVDEVMSLMRLDTVGDSPTSESAKAMGANLRKQGYSMGIWDHHSHTPAVYRNYLSEQRFISDILTGDRFTVWGWADTPQRASLACAYSNPSAGTLLAPALICFTSCAHCVHVFARVTECLFVWGIAGLYTRRVSVSA